MPSQPFWCQLASQAQVLNRPITANCPTAKFSTPVVACTICRDRAKMA
jgi:hypothetical protein